MGNEIPKYMKIALLINAVVCLLFSVLFLIITETYIELTEPTLISEFTDYTLFGCAFYMRVDGMVLLLFAIFDFYLLKVNDFDKFKIYFEFGIFWINGSIALNIYGLIAAPVILGGTVPATLLSNMVLNTVILAVFDVVWLYYYLQEVRG